MKIKNQTKARIMIVIFITSIVLFISGVILEPFIVTKVAQIMAFTGFIGMIAIILITILIPAIKDVWNEDRY